MCQLITLHFRDKSNVAVADLQRQTEQTLCSLSRERQKAERKLRSCSALRHRVSLVYRDIAGKQHQQTLVLSLQAQLPSQSPLSHIQRQQSCRSEPVSVSSMPSANRPPTPASLWLKEAHTHPQPEPMPASQDLLSRASNSSGLLPSVPRLSTSGLPS
jgi:hypothetical protein